MADRYPSRVSHIGDPFPLMQGIANLIVLVIEADLELLVPVDRLFEEPRLALDIDDLTHVRRPVLPSAACIWLCHPD